jgi:hypothetical protein
MWEPRIEELGNFKSSFVLGLDDKDIRLLKENWRILGVAGQGDQPNVGTFAITGYEWGYFLRISSDNRYELIPYYDQNMVTDYSYGPITESADGEVVLHPQRSLMGTGRGLRTTPLVWIPVMNGRLIVPKEKIKSFGDYYGGFGIFNGLPRKMPCDGCGAFAHRLDRHVNNEADQAIAPAKYLKYIKRPVEGNIISVGRKYRATRNDSAGMPEISSVTKVKINVGIRDGARAGLMFFLIGNGDDYFQILRVTRTYQTTSDGEIIRHIDESGKEVYIGDFNKKANDYEKIAYPPIKPGIRITTSPLVNK